MILLIFSNSSINSKMKRMLTILAYALIAYALLLILLFVFQRSYLYFPDRETIPLHYFDEFNIEEIKHTTDDGLTLAGWYKQPDTKNTNIFFLMHGNAGHVGHRVEKFRKILKAGYGFFFLEYRGYGGNPGKPTEKGLHLDALSALNFLREKKIPDQKIILYGESLGTGIAVQLGTTMKAKAIILETPYTSIADLAQQHYWYLPAKWLIFDRFELLGIIENIQSPLLILHGEKDKITDISYGQKVFEAAPQPKESFFVPYADHNNLFDFKVDEKILLFLETL